MAITVYPAPSAGKIEYMVRFNSTQSWVCPAGVTSIEAWVASGGGGGGAGTQCGGGGGSVNYNSFTVVPGRTYTMTVGAGGTGGAFGGNNPGNNGSASSIYDTVAMANLINVSNNGAGNTNGGMATFMGGAGGQGWNNNFSGSIHGREGAVGFFNLGGGGGGGIAGTGGNANGAVGQHGAGRSYGNAGSGDSANPNTGGGGGGGGFNGTYFAGGNGGSGTIIIRYWA